MLTRRFDYIVTQGDTLFGIALKFNVPLQTLIEINNLKNPDLITVGQVIEIPVSEEFNQIAELVKRQCSNSEAVPAMAVENNENEKADNIIYRRHRIRRGDTVYLLAKEYGTTTGNILALNPEITDVRNLQIGTMITIPVPPENSFIYVVRPGDTVYRIAMNNGLTVEDIMKYNYIESDYTLYPGQQIVVVRQP
ncbi:MAG: LysM peptidoglycan-binding domain-containing protein [Clostridia bacterium]|nr:LysM peptidoglycan-binding domain-containing protein [Clostridia bacterium]